MLSQDPVVQKLAQAHLLELNPALAPAGQMQSAGVEGGEQLPVP
jgi:hypothetical protein